MDRLEVGHVSLVGRRHNRWKRGRGKRTRTTRDGHVFSLLKDKDVVYQPLLKYPTLKDVFLTKDTDEVSTKTNR